MFGMKLSLRRRRERRKVGKVCSESCVSDETFSAGNLNLRGEFLRNFQAITFTSSFNFDSLGQCHLAHNHPTATFRGAELDNWKVCGSTIDSIAPLVRYQVLSGLLGKQAKTQK
jgi:hypothetical protein